MTDAELLARSLGGDEVGFQILYDRHAKAVFQFAWLMTSTVADAEDVTQEVFLVLLRKGSSFDSSKAQLRTWLLSVTRNLCLQHLQRGSRNEPLDPDLRAHSATAEQTAIASQIEYAVRRAVEALPHGQREAVFLFEFEGLSLKELSSILSIEINAVKARLHRGREQLKQSLAEYKSHVSPSGKE